MSGLEVTQLRLDFQFHVQMWALDRELLITFGTQFTLRLPAGEIETFDPELGEGLCPMLSLLPPVAVFAASSGGACTLRFEDGSELRAEPRENFEARESSGTGELEGAALLCGIGGGPPWG